MKRLPSVGPKSLTFSIPANTEDHPVEIFLDAEELEQLFFLGRSGSPYQR